jgi:hypothetical protein
MYIINYIADNHYIIIFPVSIFLNFFYEVLYEVSFYRKLDLHDNKEKNTNNRLLQEQKDSLNF